MANRDDLAKTMRPDQIAELVYGATEHDAIIRDYLETGGQHLNPAEQAWCAAFVNATLAHAGLPGTNSQAARSFENYGDPVLSPREGDIGVFARDKNAPDYSPALGHAGFYKGTDPETGEFQILGGNTSDSVAMASIPTERLLQFRRPSDMAEPQQPTSVLSDPQLAAGINMTTPFQKPAALDMRRGRPGGLEAVGGVMTPAMATAINPPPQIDPRLASMFGRL